MKIFEIWKVSSISDEKKNLKNVILTIYKIICEFFHPNWELWLD
jgi:hypothetical protein